MNAAFDLSALRDVLSKYPEYKELRKAIDRFLGACSFEIDLASCANTLDLLREISLQPADVRAKVGSALMISAAIIYCRAAIEDGNGRFKIGITKDYSQDLLAKHKDVVKLRNKSLAHFDVGAGAYGELWINERAVLKVVGAKASVVPVWKRANYLAQLIADMEDLCAAARARVSRCVQDRRLEVLKLLPTSDRRLMDLVRQVPFDPVAYFGPGAGAADFWLESDSFSESFQPKEDLVGGVFATSGPAIVTRLP